MTMINSSKLFLNRIATPLKKQVFKAHEFHLRKQTDGRINGHTDQKTSSPSPIIGGA